MSIKYILFDLDGTLINTNDIIIKCLRDVSIKYANKDLTEDELGVILGKPLRDQVSLIFNENIDEMMEHYRINYRANVHGLILEFEGVAELLQELYNEGYTMGIVSSKGRRGINEALKKFHMEKYFKAIVAANDVENHKPHAEPLEKGLELLGASKEEAIFVGDSYFDILCAKNAGVKSVLVDWSILPRCEIMKLNPDYVLTNSMDFAEILRGI